MSSFQGLLLVDKPAGITSHDLVGRARKLLKTRSIGHAGTLDPMATGLMVLLVGDATKLSNWILNGDKAYVAGVRFGLETDTWDITGKSVQEESIELSAEEVFQAAKEMTGLLDLPVPQYSAIKKNGKKLYEYAREGKEVAEERRAMNFYEVTPLEFSDSQLQVALACSKGSYIRSWAYQLGRNLRGGACLSSLRRTFSSPYRLQAAKSIEEIAEILQAGVPSGDDAIIPIEKCLPDWPEIHVEGRDEKFLSNGGISDGLRSRIKMVDLAGFESGRIDSESREKAGIKVFGRELGGLLAILVPKDPYTYKIAKVFYSGKAQ